MPTLVGASASARGDGTVPTKVGTYQSAMRWAADGGGAMEDVRDAAARRFRSAA